MSDLHGWDPDSPVPGMYVRRLAQMGRSSELRRRLLRKNASHEATMSMELLLQDLVGEGDLADLRYWAELRQGFVRFKPDSFATAALNGYTDIVEYMIQSHPTVAVATPALLKQVVALGHYDVAVILRERIPPAEVLSPEQDKNELIETNVSPANPVSSAAAIEVLLSSTLLPLIYSFQPRPAHEIKMLEENYEGEVAANELRGLLMRLALIHGDLAAVRHVHVAAEMVGFAGPPKLSLRTAMHDAAVEGRLDALAWLHLQPGVGQCRPDTMAAVVRTGRSDVVRWLHANVPESMLSMSASPLIDAARWGLLDVLQTCHELKIPDAIVDVGDRATWSQAALDTAIEHDHLSVVSWLVSGFELTVSPHVIKPLLVEAKSGMIGVLRETNGLRPSVDAVCIEIAEAPRQLSTVKYAAANGLLSVSGASEVAVRVLRRPCGEPEDVVLRKLLTRYPPCAASMLFPSVQLENERGLRIVLDSRALPPHSLAQALQVAISERRTKVLPILVGHSSLHSVCADALPLLASYGELSWVQQVFPNRTHGQAIAALEQATTLEIASFLLRHEDKFFTEAVLLAKIPACVSAPFVRYLLKHGRSQDTHAVECFSRVLDENLAPLSVGEVHTVRFLGDSTLDELVKRCFKSIVSWDTASVDHSSTVWPDVLEYLHSLGVAFPPDALDASITRGRLDEVEWLIRECGVSVQGITASCIRSVASKSSHAHVLEYLHHFDLSKSSHGLRLGIRLAYEDALATADESTASHLLELDAGDVSPLRLELVADEGHAKLAASLAQGATRDAVVEALTRSAERGHWSVVVVLMDARSDVPVDMALRVRLAGLAFSAGEFDVARKIVGVVLTTSKHVKRR